MFGDDFRADQQNRDDFRADRGHPYEKARTGYFRRRSISAAALPDPDHGLQAAIDLADQDDPRGVQALDAAVRDAEHGPVARRRRRRPSHAHRITPGLVAALADDNAVVRVEAAGALAC